MDFYSRCHLCSPTEIIFLPPLTNSLTNWRFVQDLERYLKWYRTVFRTVQEQIVCCSRRESKLFDQLKNKRVLVTGHTGFKGTWLTMWLKKIGAHVAGYALEPDTTPSLYRLTDIQNRIEHTVSPIEDFDKLQSVFDHFQPQVVFHLAAQPLVRKSYLTPRETFGTNVQGTVNVLEAIRNTNSVEAAVMITTDKVYKNNEWRWGYRENEPLGGHDPYSASKGACELAISAYQNSFFENGHPPIFVASARSGNVIGGGDFAEDRLIPDAIRAAIANRPMAVRSPLAIRPWQHVLDSLGAYLLLSCKLLEHGAAYTGAWNFGPQSGDTLSVGELVRIFYRCLGTGTVDDAAAQTDHSMHEATTLKLCCDKAREKLGWTPRYATTQALTLTSFWYEQVLFRHRSAYDVCEQQLEHYMHLLESPTNSPQHFEQFQLETPMGPVSQPNTA